MYPFLEDFALPSYNTAGHAGKTTDSFHLSYDASIGPSHFQLEPPAIAPVLGQAMTSAASSGQSQSSHLSSLLDCPDVVSSSSGTAFNQPRKNEQNPLSYLPDCEFPFAPPPCHRQYHPHLHKVSFIAQEILHQPLMVSMVSRLVQRACLSAAAEL